MPRIGMKPLAQMLRRIGVSLRAGVDTRTVWAKEATFGSTSYQQQVAQVSQGVNSGDSLAVAMASCGDYFPPLTLTLVDVGEKTGRLEDVLLGVAEHYEHMLALRKTFLMGVAWPAIQLGLATLILGGLILILGFLPTGPGGEPNDILGFGLVGTSGAMTFFGMISVVAAGMTVFVLALLRGALGPAPIQLAMRVPVIGNCLKTSALSRLAWTLSLSLDSGVDAKRAIRMALQSTENAYYTTHLDEVLASVDLGHEFHEALRATGIFPNDFIQALEMAEISGTHGESLNRLAMDYRDRTKAAAKALTIAATTAVWLFVMALVGFLVLRMAYVIMIQPIYEALEPM